MAHPTKSKVFKAGWRCWCRSCGSHIEKGQPCQVVYINRKCKVLLHEKCA